MGDRIHLKPGTHFQKTEHLLRLQWISINSGKVQPLRNITILSLWLTSARACARKGVVARSVYPPLALVFFAETVVVHMTFDSRFVGSPTFVRPNITLS